MTQHDHDADEEVRLGEAVVALTEACFAIARHFGVCPLCLMYASADLASEAEDNGEAHHLNAVLQTHPAHKTVL